MMRQFLRKKVDLWTASHSKANYASKNMASMKKVRFWALEESYMLFLSNLHGEGE